jgi:hypothetical protein
VGAFSFIVAEVAMRVFLGILLGIILTIGTAYIVDSLQSTSGPEEAARRKMVNWDVVAQNLQSASAALQDGWARVTGHGR